MSPVSWSFTTAHAGLRSSVSPASGATGIAVPDAVLLMSLSATFNEPVQPSTITLTWVDSSGNRNPLYHELLGRHQHHHRVAPGVAGELDDLHGDRERSDGRRWRHDASPFTWSFTTASATAVTMPTVTSVSPAYNGSSVDVSTPIAVNFNEAVLASSISAANFTLVSASGTAVPATISYSDIGTLHTATLTPTAELAYSTTYTATISGVQDAAGNTMASPYTWSFATASGSQTNTQLPWCISPTSNTSERSAFRTDGIGLIDFNYAGRRRGIQSRRITPCSFLGIEWTIASARSRFRARSSTAPT